MIPFIFPNFRGPYIYKNPSNFYLPRDLPTNCNKFDNKKERFSDFEKNTYNNDKNITKEEQESNSCSSDNSFDFFGIKLASDDLIILGLLFFLYNEKVEDNYLFIVLILLLLN